MKKKFPGGVYGRQKLNFFPAPYRAPLRAFAALVFPWQGDKVVLCNIGDRGWCIPSGRVEPNETSCEAVKREALEEAGAVLTNVQYIGCYKITDRNQVRWADVYAASVESLCTITMPEESLGRQLLTLDQVPDIYHEWNELIAMVFEYSKCVVDRSARP